MGEYRIRKGFDIRLSGRPESVLTERLDAATVTAYPLEYEGVKQRLKVEEGQAVKRGDALIEDKRDPRFKVCAPAGGTVTAIKRGERRFVERVVIEVAKGEQAATFERYTPDQISTLGRDPIIEQLLRAGYLVFLRQRPFSRMADPAATPKSIFVNAAHTAPFRGDAGVAVDADTEAFQAGVDLLGRLTDGAVHVCIGPDAAESLKSVQRAKVHTFRGPHPSGNTSVHIAQIDPLKPGDTVWAVSAADLVLIGRLFLDGKLPVSRVVSLGGPSVRESARRHYRMRIGAPLATILSNALEDGDHRLIDGDVLSGSRIAPEDALGLCRSSITVLPEDRERHFLGWLAPGFGRRSFSRLFASALLGPRDWPLGTNRNGGHRAMVLTGLYDKVMPLDIMVDFLVRAVLAGDTDEAVRLGILETDPEDFALCDYVCPCKTEIQDIIRRGLEQIAEEEGL